MWNSSSYPALSWARYHLHLMLWGFTLASSLQQSLALTGRGWCFTRAHGLNVGLLTLVQWKEKIERKNKMQVNSLHISTSLLTKRKGWKPKKIGLSLGRRDKRLCQPFCVTVAPTSAGAGWIQALQRDRTAFGVRGLRLVAGRESVKRRSFHIYWYPTANRRTEATAWAILVVENCPSPAAVVRLHRVAGRVSKSRPLRKHDISKVKVGCKRSADIKWSLIRAASQTWGLSSQE